MDKVIEIERLVSLAASLSVPNKSELDDISGSRFPWTEDFYPVLDAIAVLCVREAKTEAFACGIQVDDTTSNIHLTLATDTADPHHAVHHIRDLWNRLKRLSNVHRLDDSDVEQKVIPEQRNKFREAVFTYSVKRQLHVFSKHFDALQSFSRQAQQLRNDSKLSCDSCRTDMAQWFVYFDSCLNVMTMFSQTFMRGYPSSSCQRSARKMGVMMEVLRVFATHLLMNKFLCNYVSEQTDCNCKSDRFDDQDLANDICTAARNAGKFPLEEHLRELVAPPRSVRALTEFASRPRSRLYFSYKLKIKIILVRNNPGHFSFPASWEDFVNTQFPMQDRPSPIVIQRVHDAFSGRIDAIRQPHVECILATYFYLLKTRSATCWSYIPPLAYLGTSEASCVACLVYLGALSSLPNAPPLHSQGSWSKWRHFWSYPLYILDEQLVKAVYEKMHEQVSLRLGIALVPFSAKLNLEAVAMVARSRIPAESP